MRSEVLQKILAKETRAGSEVKVEMASGCGHAEHMELFSFTNDDCVSIIMYNSTQGLFRGCTRHEEPHMINKYY